MSDGLRFALTLAAALGSGLIAGVFFAFSTFVMTALGRLSPAQGIAAMQSINVAVINPVFLGTLFGTGVVCVVLAAVALMGWQDPGAAWLLAGSLLYVVGDVVVTMAFNVPLNNALAAADPASADGAALWARYLKGWTAWNHVRTAAGLVATAAFFVALV
jgi:uncharacterized membrane protein